MQVYLLEQRHSSLADLSAVKQLTIAMKISHVSLAAGSTAGTQMKSHDIGVYANHVLLHVRPVPGCRVARRNFLASGLHYAKFAVVGNSVGCDVTRSMGR